MIALPDDARVILCDVWGVLHDGVAAFPPALDALDRWRAEGRIVVLLTNAPRPSVAIARQLDGLGLTKDHYDALVTSGDAGLAFVRERGGACALIGTARDRAALAEAGFVPGDAGDEPIVVCTGLDERRRDPADYHEELARMRARGALLACFNPDRVVLHDGAREVCAGAIGDRYAAMGGEVVFTGKPFAPIYARALDLASLRLGRLVERGEAIAIGDGIATDMAGAAREGLRFVFVAAGIERDEIARVGLEQVLAEAADAHTLGTARPILTVEALA
ncbi:TIGR01459 family HAD-type hydrolase [Sphingomonas sp.]|uniref:TIGR01459 family HAD-type hydrolase n=1 Tax=Sphingomonas sp. TaxID=28214 RepID=UPI003B00053F